MLIGYKEISHPKLLKQLGRLQLFALIFLLFVMGLRIGSDQLVVSNIGRIGLKALFIAVGTIVFSVLFVWIYRHITKRNHEGNRLSLETIESKKYIESTIAEATVESGGVSR